MAASWFHDNLFKIHLLVFHLIKNLLYPKGDKLMMLLMKRRLMMMKKMPCKRCKVWALWEMLEMEVAICPRRLCQPKMWSHYCCKDRPLSWIIELMTIVTVREVISPLRKRAAHHEKYYLLLSIPNQSVHFTTIASNDLICYVMIKI